MVDTTKKQEFKIPIEELLFVLKKIRQKLNGKDGAYKELYP